MNAGAIFGCTSGTGWGKIIVTLYDEIPKGMPENSPPIYRWEKNNPENQESR